MVDFYNLMKFFSTLLLCFFCSSSLMAVTDRGDVIFQLSEALKAGTVFDDDMCITEQVGSHQYEYYTESLSDGTTQVLKLDFKKKGDDYVLQNHYMLYILEPDGDIEVKEYDGHGDVQKGTKTETSFDGDIAVRVDEKSWSNGAWVLSGYTIYDYDLTQDAVTILGSPVAKKKLAKVMKYDAQDTLLSVETYYYNALSSSEGSESGSKIDRISIGTFGESDMTSVDGSRAMVVVPGRIIIQDGKKTIIK